MQKHSNDELIARFKDWCPEVRKILSLTGTYLKWKLADFDRLDNWIHPSNKGVLLGDAGKSEDGTTGRGRIRLVVAQ